MDVEIRTGSIEEAHAILTALPEFVDPYPSSEIKIRLAGNKNLILLAYNEGKAVGFKIGYHWNQDESGATFYSWLGGILPLYRRQGIATRLAREQEGWARLHQYKKLRLKSKNQHVAMLQFALQNGFLITGLEKSTEIHLHRIILEKIL